MRFDLRHVSTDNAEAVLREACGAPDVHGILVFYPILGRPGDRWLRELVDPRKDVEGLHSFWAHCLYENRRFLDAERTQRAILPCTPLAVLKLVEATGITRPAGARPLEGVRACVFNRSEVVGYPLAAMMANDGARVVSFDIDGPLAFMPAEGQGPHRVQAIDIDRAAALAEADLVITGVPTREFALVRANELKPGAVCINFSTFRNYHEDVAERASVLVPRVGPMTVTMALRNALRLYRNAAGGRGP